MSEAAKTLGVSPATVRKRIIDGSLSATKVSDPAAWPLGWRWEIDPASVEANKGQWRGRGRYRQQWLLSGRQYGPDDRTVVAPPQSIASKLKRKLAYDSWWGKAPRPEWLNEEDWQEARRKAAPAVLRVVDEELQSERDKLKWSIWSGSKQRHRDRIMQWERFATFVRGQAGLDTAEERITATTEREQGETEGPSTVPNGSTRQSRIAALRQRQEHSKRHEGANGTREEHKRPPGDEAEAHQPEKPERRSSMIW